MSFIADAVRFIRNNDVLLRPSTLVNTLRCLAVSEGEPRRLVRVLVNSSVSLRLSKGCQIAFENEGRLLLGAGHTAGSLARDPSLLEMKEGARLVIRGRARLLPGFRMSIGPQSTVELGSSWINWGSRVFVRERLSIGDRCAIGWGVVITDSDFHQMHLEHDQVRPNVGPVVIGNRVWIGAEAMILKSVSIGDGAIVAARSLVTRDVPPRTLVAGQPARVVKANVDWE